MNVYDYIRQRMMNYGFNPDDIVIEPYPFVFDGVDQIIDANNLYYFLYEVTEYTHKWLISAANDILSNDKFILDEKIPSGIYDFTGDIQISSGLSQDNTFMFYKVTPGNILPPAPIPNPDPIIVDDVPQDIHI